MAIQGHTPAPARKPLRAKLAPALLILLGVGALLIGLNFLLVPTAMQKDSVAALAGQQYVDVQLAAFDAHPLLIRVHVAMGVVFTLLAALQFWRSFRNRNLKRHRILGYVGFACLSLLPVTGVATAIVYPFAGMAAVWPNLFWSLVIGFCVVSAWRAIRRRDVISHEAWVTRATGMTLGITLSRVYEPILVNVFHMDVRLAFAVVFWLGQGEGLALAELWLRRSQGPMARRAAARLIRP